LKNGWSGIDISAKTPQAHQRDRRFGDRRHKIGEAVEVRIGCRIHGVETLEQGQPVRIDHDADAARRQPVAADPLGRCFPTRNLPEQGPFPDQVVPEAPAAAQHGGQ